MLNSTGSTSRAAHSQAASQCHACRTRVLLARRPPTTGGASTACKAVSPESLQDIIVGGAVFGAAGFAVYSGLKKDPVPCSLCQGTGGVRCFACGGDGRTASAASSRDELYDGTPGPGPAPRQRDMLGRSVDPRECRVCNGVGLVPCSQCRGSGFQGTF